MDAVTQPTAPSTGQQATAAWADSVAAAVGAIPARIGARASTNAAQAILAVTNTNVNNNGAASWSSLEDSGGFVSATGGTITPIIIPAGKGGLYIVGLSGTFSVASGARAQFDLAVNGTWWHGTRAVCGGNGSGAGSLSAVLPMVAGTTLGIQAYNSTAANVQTATEIYCYRIGD